MHNRLSLNRRSWALAGAPLLAVASMAVFAAGPATAHATAGQSNTVRSSATHTSARSVAPNKNSMVDCNGWSPKYRSISQSFRMHCTDPRGKIKGAQTPWIAGGKTYKSNGRFMDNGHYVGHDEPSVKFISSATGSGNTMTYYMQVPHEPAKAPTNSGSVVDYAELSPAPWFGLPICDPNSYPLNPCTPDSDTNVGSNVPTAAGSAFMELQFYPPGFAPFADDVSCSAKFWCSAMTIDSLESDFNFAHINLNCEEPVNFAFIQRNGVPAGPPSPQRTDFQTFTPNSHTLQIHDGDVLRVAISDPDAGFTIAIDDETTHQSGHMTASAANGFMNTNPNNCKGTPFTFHAEYNTAKQQNQVPWAALQGGVLMQQEIGHAETCTKLANNKPISGFGVTDKHVFDTCLGGSEGAKSKKGEGTCNANTGVCSGAETEGTTGPIACPSNNFASGQLCEFSDGNCMPQGNRTVILHGKSVKENSPVNWCQDNRFENGDLDFDGLSYRKTTWPNGSPNVPNSFRYAGPFSGGKSYPTIQFETPVGASEFLCNIFDGLNCDAPPLGAKFYPFWSLTNKAASGQGIGTLFKGKGQCIWNFGNDIPTVTTNDFRKAKQYGQPDVAVFGGTLISAPAKNPEVTGNCPALTDPVKAG